MPGFAGPVAYTAVPNNVLYIHHEFKYRPSNKLMALVRLCMHKSWLAP